MEMEHLLLLQNVESMYISQQSMQEWDMGELGEGEDNCLCHDTDTVMAWQYPPQHC